MAETRNPVRRARPRLDTNYWKLWVATVVSNIGDGVGAIAYPWIASSVTRNVLLIAGIGLAQQLPWLLFALPAGVITDRYDRRKLMVTMDVVRAALVGVMAFVVLSRQDGLPTPDIVEAGLPFAEDLTLYGVLLVGAFLLGFAEVLRDNASQTILPSIVDTDDLETANGRMWAAEGVSNSFVGPLIGAALLGVALALPLGFDAVSFAIAAVLVATLKGTFAPPRAKGATADRPKWTDEVREGVRWLRAHTVLWPMAVTLGLMMATFSFQSVVFVLWAQEILGADARILAYLGTAGAIGGVVGSLLGKKTAARVGPGTALFLALIILAAVPGIVGFVRDWRIVWLLLGIAAFVGTVWNIITVSFRQAIIPDDLLGRVNSVYRFVSWGMLPAGVITGGLVVRATEVAAGRDLALRMPYLVAAIFTLGIALWARPKLTTEKLEVARAAGDAARRERDAAKGDTPDADS
ncbi:hypothetical protein MNBD_ACTINO02-3012 [hydrothermal vent metagenome]|uniref:Antibiotic efflux protein n=1 Tax=hydrothermal vent metagenome TaxID=652676 RepID=A0A3B0RUC5_9ZZZZ